MSSEVGDGMKSTESDTRGSKPKFHSPRNPRRKSSLLMMYSVEYLPTSCWNWASTWISSEESKGLQNFLDWAVNLKHRRKCTAMKEMPGGYALLLALKLAHTFFRSTRCLSIRRYEKRNYTSVIHSTSCLPYFPISGILWHSRRFYISESLYEVNQCGWCGSLNTF